MKWDQSRYTGHQRLTATRISSWKKLCQDAERSSLVTLTSISSSSNSIVSRRRLRTPCLLSNATPMPICLFFLYVRWWRLSLVMKPDCTLAPFLPLVKHAPCGYVVGVILQVAGNPVEVLGHTRPGKYSVSWGGIPMRPSTVPAMWCEENQPAHKHPTRGWLFSASLWGKKRAMWTSKWGLKSGPRFGGRERKKQFGGPQNRVQILHPILRSTLPMLFVEWRRKKSYVV